MADYIKKCPECSKNRATVAERKWEHKVCTECGGLLVNAQKPNPEYIVEYEIKNACSQCGRSNFTDHTGKYCPIEGGEFSIKRTEEEITLKGSGFKPDGNYPFKK